MNPGEGWRLLKVGEVIGSDDEYFSSDGKWWPPGQFVGEQCDGSLPFRRKDDDLRKRVERIEWLEKRRREAGAVWVPDEEPSGKVDPGAGRRMLSVGEVIVEGDECFFDGEWSADTGCTGERCDGTLPIRRKAIDPGAGWRLLNAGEVVVNGDEYLTGCRWHKCMSTVGSSVGSGSYSNNIKAFRRRGESHQASSQAWRPIMESMIERAEGVRDFAGQPLVRDHVRYDQEVAGLNAAIESAKKMLAAVADVEVDRLRDKLKACEFSLNWWRTKYFNTATDLGKSRNNTREADARAEALRVRLTEAGTEISAGVSRLAKALDERDALASKVAELEKRRGITLTDDERDALSNARSRFMVDGGAADDGTGWHRLHKKRADAVDAVLSRDAAAKAGVETFSITGKDLIDAWNAGYEIGADMAKPASRSPADEGRPCDKPAPTAVWVETLKKARRCIQLEDPKIFILGNVRAGELVKAIDTAITSFESLDEEAGKLRAQAETLIKKVEARRTGE